MHFGKISQYLLFGGGTLLAQTATGLKQRNKTVLVVTSDRHAAELIEDGKKPVQLTTYLRRQRVPFHISSDVGTDEKVLARITPETLGLSMGAAWIFKKDFIERFEGKLVNFHGTRLPQNRGGGGFSWRILRDDRIGFNVAHLIEPGVDTGAILKYESYFYPHSCTLPIDYERYSREKYHPFVKEFLKDIQQDKEFTLINQQEYFSTYWPRLSTDVHGYIDWNWSLSDLERFIRAFDDPYPGAGTFWNDTPIRLKKCLSTVIDGSFHPFQSGIVYRVTKEAIFIAAGSGSLIVREIFDSRGTNITAQIRVGDRLHTPQEQLDTARKTRTVYTPLGRKG